MPKGIPENHRARTVADHAPVRYCNVELEIYQGLSRGSETAKIFLGRGQKLVCRLKRSGRFVATVQKRKR